jgi:hypothetical protein
LSRIALFGVKAASENKNRSGVISTETVINLDEKT